MKTILTKKELADRWGTDVSTIDIYEKEGYIKRLNLPGAKYSIVSAEALEYDGIPELLAMKDKEIKHLKSQIMKMKNVIDSMREILSSY